MGLLDRNGSGSMNLFEFTRCLGALEGRTEEGGVYTAFQGQYLHTHEPKIDDLHDEPTTYTCLCTIFDPVRLRFMHSRYKKQTNDRWRELSMRGTLEGGGRARRNPHCWPVVLQLSFFLTGPLSRKEVACVLMNV